MYMIGRKSFGNSCTFRLPPNQNGGHPSSPLPVPAPTAKQEPHNLKGTVRQQMAALSIDDVYLILQGLELWVYCTYYVGR
jgi:hypothetical protein